MVVNNSGHYIKLMQLLKYETESHELASKSNSYFLAPNDNLLIEFAPEKTRYILLRINYLSGVNKDSFNEFKGKPVSLIFQHKSIETPESESANFRTPNAEYAQTLVKAKRYFPIITITNDPKTNTPVINAPSTMEELQAHMETVKKETLAPVTKEVHKVTGLPHQAGGIAGIISALTAEEE